MGSNSLGKPPATFVHPLEVPPEIGPLEGATSGVLVSIICHYWQSRSLSVVTFRIFWHKFIKLSLNTTVNISRYLSAERYIFKLILSQIPVIVSVHYDNGPTFVCLFNWFIQLCSFQCSIFSFGYILANTCVRLERKFGKILSIYRPKWTFLPFGGVKFDLFRISDSIITFTFFIKKIFH